VKHYRWILLLGMIGFAGCESPSDQIFEPPSFTPVEEAPGVFRVTFGEGPEVVRAVTEDFRLLVRAFDLVPFGDDWVLVSIPLTGGLAREELGVYRPALADDLAHLVAEDGYRILVLWKHAVPRVHGCPDSSLTDVGIPGPAPRTPSPVGLTLYSLPELDGTPVAAIPSRFVSTNLVVGEGTIQQRVRVTPVLRDADRTGTNAFGPVILPGTGEMVFSDGERLWQAHMLDTSVAPTPIGLGAYPALSSDGSTLAYARPIGIDSTIQTFTIPLGLAACVEEYVELSAAAWQVIVRDLESGEEAVVADGSDPAFDPRGERLVVRRDQLFWVDLPSGATAAIPGTSGGFSPALSPDGSVLAFSRLNSPTNSDVYFTRIAR